MKRIKNISALSFLISVISTLVCSCTTVIPKGDIIYRLIPTASHSFEDIDTTLNAFEDTKKKLDAGKYKAAEIPNMAEVAS